MEIPYTVKPRPDTGLFNSKVGIWLFLASEVMLFGGLFSSYIFLRLNADYPWPVQDLNYVLGWINTFILIFSSVTVLQAWASLKLRQWGKFKLYLTLTVLCAGAFMCIKAYEYQEKFKHYGLKMVDGTVLEGHLSKAGAKHDLGYRFHDITEITVEHRKLGTDVGFLKKYLSGSENFPIFNGPGGEKIELTQEWLKTNAAERKAKHLPPVAITLIPTEKFSMNIDRRKVKFYDANGATLVDGTSIKGTLGDAGGAGDDYILTVNKIDFRMTEDWEKSQGLAILETQHKSAEVAKRFKAHYQEEVSKFHKRFGQHESYKESALAHKRVMVMDVEPPTGPGEHGGEASAEGDHGAHHGLEVRIPEDQVRFVANHTPRYNTYYAIYFILTGLHGLHVIGGALVLLYMMVFGRKLFERDPEHLANRVEVAGLFWHLVDLVWIFLFPLLYLL